MTALIDDPLPFLDERPPTEALTCTHKGCTAELTYAGTGRKPTKCEAHKRTRTAAPRRAAPSATSSGTSNSVRIAEQAADVLCQLNDLGALGLAAGGLYRTASALSDRSEAFREQAVSALTADPGLSRTILRAGATSGKAALLVAYGMLAASIAPVAMEEVRGIRAEKAAAKESAEAEADSWAVAG